MQFKIEAQDLKAVMESAKVYRDEGVFDVRDEGLLMRFHDRSNTALYSSFIPENAMENYSPGEASRIGVRIEALESLLPSTEETVDISLETGSGAHKLVMKRATRDYRIPLIDADSVGGRPDTIPELDHCINIDTDFEVVRSFLKEMSSLFPSEADGSLLISAREGHFYLWSQKDAHEISEAFPWEDFNDYNINWDNAKYEDSPSVPDEKAVESSFQPVFLKEINADSDHDVTLSIDHDYPLKVVENRDNGIKQSWIVPPLIDDGDMRRTLPERLIKDRGVTA